MSNNDHQSPSQMFNTANQNFKRVFYAGKNRERHHLPNKYKWLPEWTLSKSKYLLNDHNRVNRKVYSRGAIVNVNFGVNIGQELSGNHFAIVLNNTDNRKNDKLTVIPLTSHEHTHTVKLDKTILNLSTQKFFNEIINQFVFHYCLYYIQYNAYKDILSDLLPPEDFYAHSYKAPNELAQQIIDLLMERLFSTIPDYSAAASYLQTRPELKLHESNLAEYTIKKEFKEAQNIAVNDLVEAFTKYQKYDKETWAKIGDIQTISKSRLMKINPMDPIGDIKVSPHVLDVIDKELIHQFTHQ